MRFPYLCLDPALLTCNDKRLRVHVTESCCDTSGCRRARKKSANSAAIQIDHSEPTSRFPNSRVLKFPNIFWCVRETSKKTWVYIYILYICIYIPQDCFPTLSQRPVQNDHRYVFFLGFFPGVSYDFLWFPTDVRKFNEKPNNIQEQIKKNQRKQTTLCIVLSVSWDFVRFPMMKAENYPTTNPTSTRKRINNEKYLQCIQASFPLRGHMPLCRCCRLYSRCIWGLLF